MRELLYSQKGGWRWPLERLGRAMAEVALAAEPGRRRARCRGGKAGKGQGMGRRGHGRQGESDTGSAGAGESGWDDAVAGGCGGGETGRGLGALGTARRREEME